jgi:polysaccharide chain length determinant protein (PEP-CTERM system associated)
MQHATLLYKEGRRRLVTLTAMFSLLAIAGLFVGLSLPKRYDASTLILVENNNVIKPLMEGRVTPTSVADQTAVLNQIVLGKKVMREVLQFGGWVKPPPARQPDARSEEQLIGKLRSHIRIETTRDEMVRISFSDSDPERAYKVTNKLAEIYLRESDSGKVRESREAFEFIDKQVKEYADKLADIHQKVLAQYRGDLPKLTTASEVTTAPTTTSPRTPRLKISAEDLADLRAQESLLETQIAAPKKAATAPKVDARAEEQARSRVLQLQAELDRLSTSLTDEHPDVKRVKRELAGAKDELDRLDKRAAARDAQSELAARYDEDFAKAARERLEAVRRKIAAATGTPMRPVVVPMSTRSSQQAAEVDPEMRSVGRDTQLSELLRRYEATRDIYQDLLKRRENARVSMELEEQHRGLGMRVQEAAELPASASSLRLMNLTMIAFFFAMAVPLAFLVLMVRLDGRVRSPHQIERLVPLLGAISYAPGHRERSRFRSRGMAAGLMLGAVFVIYLATFIFKLRAS